MKLKVLIIILAVLLVLYVVGLGMSGCKRREIGDEPPGWVDGLGGKTQPKLRASEVASSVPSGCKSQFANGRIVLAQGGSCVLTISESSGLLFRASVRAMPFQLSRGTSAHIDVNPIEPDRFDTGHDLPNPSSEPQIYKQGGTVTIQCLITFDQCWIDADWVEPE